MTFFKHIAIITFASSICFTSTATADQTDIDRVQQAAGKRDVAALTALATQMTGYEQAFANYKLAISARIKRDKATAESASTQAITQLESLAKVEPQHIEAKALLAQLYGFKIALQPIKAMILGPKSASYLADAETLAPNNPRVHLFKGISKANTPSLFGGSDKAAMTAFNAAIKAYASDKHSGYYWGEAEAYTWRGLMYQSQGDHEKAKRDWQHALVIEPSYRWAQHLLKQTNS